MSCMFCMFCMFCTFARFARFAHLHVLHVCTSVRQWPTKTGNLSLDSDLKGRFPLYHRYGPKPHSNRHLNTDYKPVKGEWTGCISIGFDVSKKPYVTCMSHLPSIGICIPVLVLVEHYNQHCSRSEAE